MPVQLGHIKSNRFKILHYGGKSRKRTQPLYDLNNVFVLQTACMFRFLFYFLFFLLKQRQSSILTDNKDFLFETSGSFLLSIQNRDYNSKDKYVVYSEYVSI